MKPPRPSFSSLALHALFAANDRLECQWNTNDWTRIDLQRSRECFWRHTNDGERDSVEPDLFAYSGGISSIALAPVLMVEHCYRAGRGVIISLHDSAPEGRLNAEPCIVASRDSLAVSLFDLISRIHIQVPQ